MLFCKSVSIPHDPVLNVNMITNIRRYHVKLSLTALNIEFVEYLKNLNLHISFVEVFYTRPNVITDIHIDANPGDITKINYIYGGLDSQMIWYKQNNDMVGQKKITSVDSDYVAFNNDEVTPVFADSLINPSIVQVGVPHNIINKNQARHCLSIVINENDKRVTMERAIEIFGATGGI